MAEDALLRTPETPFGKYQLMDRIAAGGMAEIYRARYQAAAGVTKPVVIKKILPHYATNKDFISMFINEATIAVGLSHGNIAQVFDFGEINGEYFLAMEFVHGQPLSRVLRKIRAAGMKGLPAPFSMLVAMEICKGLHYAHTKLDERGQPLNIIHRDVSPQNIIISYEGQVKIVDFGIARARHAGTPPSETTAVKGKYMYFAPEQAKGKELDGRTDVFATGVVLYEMLCGRMPFEGKMMEVLGKIIRGDFEKPKSANPAIPTALERIVLTSMALDKSDRYATAQAMHDALSRQLYSFAPSFSPAMLAALMNQLYEKELLLEGIATRIPPGFSDQLAVWCRPLPDEEGERSTRLEPKTPPSGIPVSRTTSGRQNVDFQSVGGQQLITGAQTRVPTPTLPRWLYWTAPVAAALAAFSLVVGFGYFGRTHLRITSSPSGGLVLVDGRPAPVVTPLLISGLAVDREHIVEVRLPGMKPWMRKLKAQRGRLILLHAKLEWDRTLAGPPPSGRRADNMRP